MSSFTLDPRSLVFQTFTLVSPSETYMMIELTNPKNTHHKPPLFYPPGLKEYKIVRILELFHKFSVLEINEYRKVRSYERRLAVYNRGNNI